MIGLFWKKIMYSVDGAVLASQKTKQVCERISHICSLQHGGSH